MRLVHRINWKCSDREHQCQTIQLSVYRSITAVLILLIIFNSPFIIRYNNLTKLDFIFNSGGLLSIN